MDPLLKKLNFKEGMKIQIWNCPEELKALEKEWKSMGLLAKDSDHPDFLLGFALSEEEIRVLFDQMKPQLREDEIFWIAYPKKSSKRYQVSINRDKGWKALGDQGYEGVRQVSINEDWSALRWRNVKFINKMTRKFSAKNQ
ncbi:hypothetical protein [Algoriphagus formosus]|uniref:hypothetical protein n=1 Tax=Algoriphagus formosus TaxID=2007308 RepID=UPI000C291BEC|nr:hypothetical protein [Algoriphagus formosus]